MRRLTRPDWRVINSALALYEASIEDAAEFDFAGDEGAAEAAIASVREKVLARLDGGGGR